MGTAGSTHDFYGTHSSDGGSQISPINGGQIKNVQLQTLHPITSSSNSDLSSNHTFMSLNSNTNLNNISINSSSSDNSCSSGGGGTHHTSGGSVGSVTSNNSNSKKRTVNFKLDIKPEPSLVNSSNSVGVVSSGGDHDSIHCVPQGILQKVPSISDLSEPESSLDLPIAQVSLLHVKIYTTAKKIYF